MGVYRIQISGEHGGGETTVSVEVDGDRGRVTEFSVRAPAGSDLAALDLAAVDLPMLVRAVLPDAGREPQAVPHRAAAGGPRRRVTAAADRADRAGGAALRTRAYRRMPEDLAEVYARSRSVNAVAAHYGVPRHTAQGWMIRLRERLDT
ncbi:hypothetical protein KZZ52_27735 [Dactylosporangium sp. AC04546]|uniref:hypothetical protein n=1 Tax=Dactylosporangium sp. AC04546 TaxID=2862460 RepID=UPI001EDDAE43|nr:hypothetical protein [Dactylosporangium sp. AC04546]WVK89058.1 hypothetical protein KZZ52_27735 [Dactylosporangium sp. AC04546]